MGNYDINFVRGYVYLGVTIDDVMSLVPLVITVKQRISDKIFMLRKISRLLTFESAVLAYILPIIDYAGFLIIACRKDDKRDLPVLQNDTLRICNMSRISDRVSIEELHANCKIVSLEQRRRKQLLGLMFLLSKDETFLHVTDRNANRITFKLPAKINPVYEHSPYYIGTKLWNELAQVTQESTSIVEFKKRISRNSKVHKNLLI